MALISADVVVDLQYGDCGKGKVVHSLASTLRYTHVMRFNGGSNAGHTIYHNGKKFVTHLVPAGVFYNTRSVVGGGCVIDVEKFNINKIDWFYKPPNLQWANRRKNNLYFTINLLTFTHTSGILTK